MQMLRRRLRQYARSLARGLARPLRWITPMARLPQAALARVAPPETPNTPVVPRPARGVDRRTGLLSPVGADAHRAVGWQTQPPFYACPTTPNIPLSGAQAAASNRKPQCLQTRARSITVSAQSVPPARCRTGRAARSAQTVAASRAHLGSDWAAARDFGILIGPMGRQNRRRIGPVAGLS
jgi:hypothetical protein